MKQGKRATLRQSSAQDRTTGRNAVAIPATCTIGERGAVEVLVTDLGANGCRMHNAAVGVTKAAPLVLRFAAGEPIGASLKWIKGGALGVRFDQTLSEQVLEVLLAQQADGNVVALRT